MIASRIYITTSNFKGRRNDPKKFWLSKYPNFLIISLISISQIFLVFLLSYYFHYITKSPIFLKGNNANIYINSCAKVFELLTKQCAWFSNGHFFFSFNTAKSIKLWKTCTKIETYLYIAGMGSVRGTASPRMSLSASGTTSTTIARILSPIDNDLLPTTWWKWSTVLIPKLPTTYGFAPSVSKTFTPYTLCFVVTEHINVSPTRILYKNSILNWFKLMSPTVSLEFSLEED